MDPPRAIRPASLDTRFMLCYNIFTDLGDNMQANNFGFFSARGAGRVAVGVFVVCVLTVSGLIWGGSYAGGKIKVDPRHPSIRSTEQ